MTRDIRFGKHHPDSCKRGPNGKFHCKRCGREVPRGARRNWCSKECVDFWNDAHDPRYQRRFLAKRDKGVCQRCGLDTRLLGRILARLGFLTRRYSVYTTAAGIWLLDALGFPPGSAYRTLWDADHRVPLVEGGEPGTKNMRTLCRPCHRVVTRDLRTRLVILRRAREGDFIRVCGEIVCGPCGQTVWKHRPEVAGGFHLLCDGRVVKT